MVSNKLTVRVHFRKNLARVAPPHGVSTANGHVNEMGPGAEPRELEAVRCHRLGGAPPAK